MIGPSLQSWGGISSVVNEYRRAGLFERWPIIYVTTYKDGSWLRKAAVAMAGFFRYVVLLATARVSVLHVHSASRWGFNRKSLFVLITWACGKPVVFHLHGAEFINVYERELGAVSRSYVEFVLNRCSVIIVLSERWRVMLKELVRRAPIRVIMNPVDSATSLCPNQGKRRGMLLFLGSLGRRKGVHVLLDAVGQLDGNLEWDLYIGGNGDLESIQAKVDELGVTDRVKLLGWVDGSKKVELLNSAAAVILPSFAEGLPMSVLEAMAHGAAVITTPVGGIPDVVDEGVEGLLVPVGDSEKLSKAITSLLEHPETVELMGIAGRKKFETQFSSDVVMPKVEAVYAELGMHRADANTGR